MAKMNCLVLRSGTYGKRGEVVELEVGKKGLTDRQKIMLEKYERPVVKVDNSKELEKVTAELVDTKAKLEQVAAEHGKTKVELEKVTAELVKVTKTK